MKKNTCVTLIWQWDKTSVFHCGGARYKAEKCLSILLLFYLCCFYNGELLLRRNRKKNPVDSWVHSKRKKGWEKNCQKSQIAQSASFVWSTMMMASRFHWNNLFTSYLPTLKLFTQKETDAGRPEICRGFTLFRVSHSQRNRGLWSLCKNQKAGSCF